MLEQDSSKLDKVAVIRLCGPYTGGSPPFGTYHPEASSKLVLITVVDFPPNLRKLVEGYSGYVDGGYQGNNFLFKKKSWAYGFSNPSYP